MSNTYSTFNKWRSTKIYGGLEITNYDVSGSISEAGILTCKDINSSTSITITSSILPTSENSKKCATTEWVKSVIPNLLTSNNDFTGINNFYGSNVNILGGYYLAFRDSLNQYGTYFGQNGANFEINNYGNSIIITAPTVDLSNTYTILKGGTNIYNYNSFFPYNGDGKNYISGETILRLGDVNITDGLLTCNNGLTLSSGSLTLPNASISDSALGPNVPLLSLSNTFVGATNTFNSLILSLNSNFSQSGSGKITQTSSTSKNTLNPTQFLGDITFATGAYRINNVNTATNILPTISCSNQLTLPNSQIINSTTPTLVDLSSSQTLTNKTLSDCTANTQLSNDNSLKLATTAFVKGQNYLTTSTASSTYQTITGMSSYLTTSTASSTYQTIAGMSSYLTSSSGSVINQYDSTNAVYTSLSQTNTSTYLIENQYNTSTITLRNKNATGTAINHSFAYNRVTLGSLLQMGANLDIILQGSGIIDQTTGTGQNIFNTLKFNNSTSNKQITLYENSATNLASNYTISVEGSTMRYNVNSGATHLFSTGSGVSTYSTHASINSNGLTMAGNRNIIQSGTGILSQTGTGINLMKNITMNQDNNLLQSGIGVITQTGTGTNALKGSTFSASNTHYNGAQIIQKDSTNNYNTSLSQSGADYNISNNTGGSIFLYATEVNLSNPYTTLKGGTSVFGYNTHFPYTDGINYISGGKTIMRGGGVEITEGPLVLRNETPINLFDTELTPNQCSVACSVGDLKFDNYTDPLITSGGGNIKFQTYNLTTPFPRFHTRLNINYNGIQVKKGHLKIYNDDETYQLQLEQISYTSYITNYAYTSSLTPYFNLRTTNSSGTQVENIRMNPSNVQITTSLQTDDIIKLQSAYTNLPSASSNNLGYIGSGYNTTIKTTTFNFTSGTPNWIAYMILAPGVWLITGQGGFQCGGTTINATTYLSLTTSSTFVIDNAHVKVDSRSYVANTINTNQIVRTIQCASGYTNIYLAVRCDFATGSMSYSSTAVAYTNIYATRIG